MSPRTAAPLRTGTWNVLTDRTSAAFEVRNFGFNRVRGSIPVRGGSVQVDARGVVTAVHAELDLAALDTGTPRRDTDLRKPNLLDSAANPVLAFDATDVRSTAEGWSAHGELRLRGTSCPLVLLVARPTDGGETLRVHATATLDRAPLGIKAPRVMIGRYVEIVLDAFLAPPA